MIKISTSNSAQPVIIGLARTLDRHCAPPPLARAEHRRMQSQVGRDLAGKVTARFADATNLATGRSHSGGTVAVAAAGGVPALGIDVQEVAQREFAVLSAFMDWSGLLDTEKDAASKFAHLWTLWEATVKCEEKFLLTTNNPAFVALAAACRPGAEGSWSAGAWWALSIRPTPRCWLTLVLRNNHRRTPAVDIWWA